MSKVDTSTAWSYSEAMAANKAKQASENQKNGLPKGVKSPEDKTSLTMQNFYELLATQMKYQDADNPMNISDMVSQMAQTRMIAVNEQMIQSINQMSHINVTSYATGMMGKEIRVALKDKNGVYTGENLVGTVEGVSLYDLVPKVFINGTAYELSQIMSVGTVPEPPKKEDEEKTDNDNQDNTNKENTVKDSKIQH